MVSGPQTLGSIDQALQQVRAELMEMDQQIQAVSDESVRLRQTAAAQYRRLAELRLDELTAGKLAADLTEADRRVNELLEQRQQQLAAQEQRLAEFQNRQTELEQARQVQQSAVDAASRKLDQAEAATQARLRQDPAYQAQLEMAQRAERIAEQAREKTDQAEEDRLEKGKPYESDPLFMYLWQRKYGTSAYRAGSLTRWLDGWVARLCRYQAARPNFSMLNEIPVRLREHWQRLRMEADQQFAQLEALEEAAAEQDGVPALRTALAEAQQKSEELDAAIREQEEVHHQLVAERSAYAAGDDDYSRQCSEVLIGELKRESFVELRRRVARTVTGEDDVIIQQLEELEQDLQEADEILAQHRQVHQRHLNRLHELEDIRRKFKQNRYDSVHSSFGNGALLGSMLTEFLRGMASSDELWKSIARQHRADRVESDPGFGSGGFGRPQGGVWKTPLPRVPRTGRRSSGGFRTGGGF